MEPHTPSQRSVWLVANLALALALFTVFYALAFYRAPEQLFRDADAGWHIRTGERIIDRATVPRVDEYSFSKPGQAWFAWEWAADAAMGLAHKKLGLRGVVLLYLALLGAASFLWVRLHWAAGGNFVFVCLFAAPMLTTAQLHWLARPHVAGWVLLLIALLLLERGRLNWFAAAVISAVWANVHGSFFLLPVLCLLYGSWRAALAAALATLATPYGWQLHVHLANYLTNTELLARVAEFQSFNYHAEGSWQVGLVLMLGFAGAFAACACGQWGRALVLLLLSAMALRTARGLPVLALAGLPLVNGALSAALSRRSLTPSHLREALAYGDRLRAIDAQLRGWAPGIVGAALLALAVLGTPAGFPAREFPVAAAAHLPEGGRLLAPDKFGGYLIYRFDGARKVYFDGRSDYYGAEFMKEYVRLLEVRPGWEKIMEKHGFTHALIPPRYSLAGVLEQKGWKRLYSDEVSVLLERDF